MKRGRFAGDEASKLISDTRNSDMPAVIPFVTFALAAMTGPNPVPSEIAGPRVDEGGAYVPVMSAAADAGNALIVAEGGLIADTPSRAAAAPDAPHGTLLEGGRS
jgi:hypothetical protein